MAEQIKTIPNQLLKHERKRRGWTQADVAGHTGTDGYTMNRWKRGRTSPSPYFRRKLYKGLARHMLKPQDS